jgi:hypothetical protein
MKNFIQPFSEFLSVKFMDGIFQIHSDVDFIRGVDEFVRGAASSAKRTQPLYYYQFSYDGALGFYKKKIGINRPG